MTVDKREIFSDLESSRVDELESMLKPAVDLIIKHVQQTESGERNIGPKFDNPKDLYRILNLDDHDLFKKALKDSETPSDDILNVFEKIMSNSVNTWHTGFMDKLYASTNPVGVLSDLLLSILNTNSHVFTVSPALTVIERKVGQKYANMFGFMGKNAGGLTFSGGSWSNITSLHMARSILFPETKQLGNTKKFAIYTSVHSHYSVEKAATLSGLGTENVFKIPVDEKGRMIVSELSKTIKKSIDDGYTPLYINATAGTTVFGSYDPFEEISVVAEEHKVWFHIDGSWGGNTIFSSNRKHHLKGCHLADSITSNPHKMLGVPTTCSFLLVPNDRIFTQANSLNAPYLFHSALDDDENFDLANGTMGCGRRADALKFYLGWLYYGTKGYQQRVDHAYDIGEYFATRISKIDGFKLISDTPPPCLQVCFYYNPLITTMSDLKGDDMTKATRYIATKLHKSGEFLIDYAPNPDDAISGEDNGEFFRVVFNSPVVSSNVIDKLIDQLISIGAEIA